MHFYPKIISYKYVTDQVYDYINDYDGGNYESDDVHRVEYVFQYDNEKDQMSNRHMIDAPAYKDEWFINGTGYPNPNTSSPSAKRRYEEAVIIWLKRIAHISAEDTLRYIKRQKEYERTYTK